MKKLIPNHFGYFITRSGRVWSAKTNRWLRLFLISGYRYVELYDYGTPKIYKVSRLVLETFVGPCPPGMQCRHLDGSRLNDNPSNLVWSTQQVNASDRSAHGTQVRGEKVGTSKLTNEQATEIRQRLRDGERRSELALEFNVSYVAIRNIHLMKTYLEA